MKCWGSDEFGQLQADDGGFNEFLTPLSWDLHDALEDAVARARARGLWSQSWWLAKGACGSVQCWGSDEFGQLQAHDGGYVEMHVEMLFGNGEADTLADELCGYLCSSPAEDGGISANF